MTEKEKVLQWIAVNNKFGKEAGFIKNFEDELTRAIAKENEIISTWMFGNELFKDENYYKLRWNVGKYTIEIMTREEADSNNIAPRSITLFEKKINESSEKDKINDTNWFNEIEEIYHTFSLIVDDKYTPGSRQEIENAKIEVEKLKGKYSGNTEFDKEIAFLDSVLKESNKRKFNGSKLTIIGVLIGILFMFYMSNKVEIKSGSLLIDKAERMQQDKIAKLESKADMAQKEIDYSMNSHNALKKEIANLKAQDETNQIIERIREREKSLAKYEKNKLTRENIIKDSKEEIEFLKSMTAEEYRDYKVNSDKKTADSVSGYAWTTVFWFLLYFASAFPFVFTINKRSLKGKKSNWLLKAVSIVLGSAQTVRYRRSDGSTYDDNSSYIAAMAFAIALPIVAIIVTIIFLPYISVIAFARNIVIPYFYSI